MSQSLRFAVLNRSNKIMAMAASASIADQITKARPVWRFAPASGKTRRILMHNIDKGFVFKPPVAKVLPRQDAVQGAFRVGRTVRTALGLAVVRDSGTERTLVELLGAGLVAAHLRHRAEAGSEHWFLNAAVQEVR